MSQLTRAVITGSPSTSPSHRKRCAATRPGSITPIGESIGAVATAISCVVRSSGSRSKPSSSATMWTDCRKPWPRMSAIDARSRHLGLLAEQHHVADDVGRVVGADVGELLGPHVRDRAGQRRDHRAGSVSVMPPGWMPVPCSVALPAAHAASSSARRSRDRDRTSRPASRRSCPNAGCAATTSGSASNGRRRRSRRRWPAPRRRRSSR